MSPCVTSALLSTLLGYEVPTPQNLADRTDEQLVLAGYTPASVRQFRSALRFGFCEADAEALLRKEDRRVA